jgi:two-component system sensor histidine kinase VicK
MFLGHEQNNAYFYTMQPPNNISLLTQRSSQLYFSYNIVNECFVYINPAFEDFFNLIDTVPTVALLLAMVHPEDQDYIIAQCKACLAGISIEDVECRVVRGEAQRTLRIFPHLIHDEGEQLLMGYAEDITPFTNQLNVVSKHNAKKNSILSILSHDLVGPIGFIQNLTDLLGREAAPWESARANEYIDRVNKISKKCVKLIRDFMDHEFLESAGVNLIKKRVNLVEKIKVQTEEYLRNQNDLQKHISLVTNQTEIFLNIDEDKFLQVINNLMSNALKFTADGGHITLTMEENTDHILIKVADDGIGIPEKFHATLFEKFTEARRTGLKGERSTGLGMSIIKTIIEWHEGTIWFESEENRGTTFYIQLPK